MKLNLILITLLLISLAGYLNHQYPERSLAIYNAICGNIPPIETPIVQPAVQTNIVSAPEVSDNIVTAPVQPIAPSPTPVPLPVWVKPSLDNFPSIWFVNGQKFENVKVMDITEESVTIMHSNGVTNINLCDLPNGSELQRKCGYNPVLAKQAMEKRAQKDQDIDKAFLENQQSIALQQEQEAKIAQQNEVAQNRADIQQRILQLSAQRDDLLSRAQSQYQYQVDKEATRRDRIISVGDGGDQLRAQAKQIDNEISFLQAQIK